MPAGCGVPESPLADFGSVRGRGGCEVARELTAAARPARPIKRKAAWAARVGAGLPAGWAVPERPLANFGNVRGAAGYGVSRSVRSAANVRVMEMHVVRRPVKGGPARMPQT